MNYNREITDVVRCVSERRVFDEGVKDCFVVANAVCCSK